MAKPDYFLYAKKKGSKAGAKIGAAWDTDWGSISIKLNPCVVLTDRDDIYINLYTATTEQPKLSDDSEIPYKPGPGNDDMPF